MQDSDLAARIEAALGDDGSDDDWTANIDIDTLLKDSPLYHPPTTSYHPPVTLLPPPTTLLLYFNGAGMGPLDPGWNSMQFAVINVPIVCIFARFEQNIMF